MPGSQYGNGNPFGGMGPNGGPGTNHHHHHPASFGYPNNNGYYGGMNPNHNNYYGGYGGPNNFNHHHPTMPKYPPNNANTTTTTNNNNNNGWPNNTMNQPYGGGGMQPPSQGPYQHSGGGFNHNGNGGPYYGFQGHAPYHNSNNNIPYNNNEGKNGRGQPYHEGPYGDERDFADGRPYPNNHNNMNDAYRNNVRGHPSSGGAYNNQHYQDEPYGNGRHARGMLEDDNSQGYNSINQSHGYSNNNNSRGSFPYPDPYDNESIHSGNHILEHNYPSRNLEHSVNVNVHSMNQNVSHHSGGAGGISVASAPLANQRRLNRRRTPNPSRSFEDDRHRGSSGSLRSMPVDSYRNEDSTSNYRDWSPARGGRRGTSSRPTARQTSFGEDSLQSSVDQRHESLAMQRIHNRYGSSNSLSSVGGSRPMPGITDEQSVAESEAPSVSGPMSKRPSAGSLTSMGLNGDFKNKQRMRRDDQPAPVPVVTNHTDSRRQMLRAQSLRALTANQAFGKKATRSQSPQPGSRGSLKKLPPEAGLMGDADFDDDSDDSSDSSDDDESKTDMKNSTSAPDLLRRQPWAAAARQRSRRNLAAEEATTNSSKLRPADIKSAMKSQPRATRPGVQHVSNSETPPQDVVDPRYAPKTPVRANSEKRTQRPSLVQQETSAFGSRRNLMKSGAKDDYIDTSSWRKSDGKDRSQPRAIKPGVQHVKEGKPSLLERYLEKKSSERSFSSHGRGSLLSKSSSDDSLQSDESEPDRKPRAKTPPTLKHVAKRPIRKTYSRSTSEKQLKRPSLIKREMASFGSRRNLMKKDIAEDASVAETSTPASRAARTAALSRMPMSQQRQKSVRQDLANFASKRNLNIEADEQSTGDVSSAGSKASASVLSGSASISRPADEKAMYRLGGAATRPGVQQVSGGSARKPGFEQVTHSQVQREFASLGMDMGKEKLEAGSPTEESKEEITADDASETGRMAWHSNDENGGGIDGITMKEMQMGAIVAPVERVDMEDATVDLAKRKCDAEDGIDIEKGGDAECPMIPDAGGDFEYAEMSMENLIEAHIVDENEFEGSIVQGVAVDLKEENRRKRRVRVGCCIFCKTCCCACLRKASNLWLSFLV